MQRIGKINIMGVLFTWAFLLGSVASAQSTTDNTKINERDTVASEMTADQQKSNESDMDITKRIRQDLMKDKKLSTYAHNVKIITMNGKVTLKGPVRSKNEVDTIMKSARATAGNANIINEMTVVPK